MKTLVIKTRDSSSASSLNGEIFPEELQRLSSKSLGEQVPEVLQLHQRLCRALEAAAAAAPCRAQADSVLEFQEITGAKKAEAEFTVQQAKGDLQAAVLNWHNQVLRTYLLSFQAEHPALLSYQQHEKLEAARGMRAKASKAALAASSFPEGAAQGYLTINLQSLCSCNKEKAEELLQQAGGDITAAVDAHIRRHLLPSAGLPPDLEFDIASTAGS